MSGLTDRVVVDIVFYGNSIKALVEDENGARIQGDIVVSIDGSLRVRLPQIDMDDIR